LKRRNRTRKNKGGGRNQCRHEHGKNTDLALGSLLRKKLCQFRERKSVLQRRTSSSQNREKGGIISRGSFSEAGRHTPFDGNRNDALRHGGELERVAGLSG